MKAYLAQVLRDILMLAAGAAFFALMFIGLSLIIHGSVKW